MLRARLAAEDGTLVIRALEVARERVLERRREERAAAARDPLATATAGAEYGNVSSAGLPRPVAVEALLDLAEAATATVDDPRRERARLVVHVDAAALTTMVVAAASSSTALWSRRRQPAGSAGDADLVAQVERHGLPVSVGRALPHDPTGAAPPAGGARRPDVLFPRLRKPTPPASPPPPALGARRRDEPRQPDPALLGSTTAWCTKAGTPSEGDPDTGHPLPQPPRRRPGRSPHQTTTRKGRRPPRRKHRERPPDRQRHQPPRRQPLARRTRALAEVVAAIESTFTADSGPEPVDLRAPT